MSPLRVGVILDTARLAAWEAWILGEIATRDHLTLALAVVGRASRPPRHKRVFELYEALDRRAFRVQPDALAPVDVSPLLAGVPRAAPQDVAAIRRHDLDVLLAFGSERPRGAVLRAARHGVWAYRHAAFGEVSAPAPVSASVLELLDEDGSTVIYESAAATDVVSLHRHRVPMLWKSSRFALRRLDDLASGAWQPPAEREPPPPEPPAPSASETIRHVGRVAGRMARRKLRNAAYQHQWFLGLRPRPGDRLPADDPAPWHAVLPPPDRSYADPFVIAEGDGTFVFLEILDHASGTGRLGVAPLEPEGALGVLEPILPMPHHASYPYVFRDGGRLFLIPETGDARRVDLYAATDFPTGWELVATLLDGVNAVDATVFPYGGRYWMWVTIAVPGARLQDETFVYSSDRLDGGWTPHPRNPVVSDARRARPAGRPFVHDGRLIRPSQCCAGRYGERVVFSHVEVLTPDDYRERPCGRMGPEWAAIPNLAAHTYTFDGGWEATDGLRAFRRGAPGTATTRH